MRQIILASTSPRRKELMRMILGENFLVCPSSYDEDNALDMEPVKLVVHHALNKAQDVALKYESGIVIGCDTIVILDNNVLGKPKDAMDAKRMLSYISGRNVEVVSGIAIIDIDNSRVIQDFESSFVKMGAMTDIQIERYVSSGEPLDKAGAFAAQGIGSIFIEKIDGCFFNVVGLPLHKLFCHLQKLDFTVLG